MRQKQASGQYPLWLNHNPSYQVNREGFLVITLLITDFWQKSSGKRSLLLPWRVTTFVSGSCTCFCQFSATQVTWCPFTSYYITLFCFDCGTFPQFSVYLSRVWLTPLICKLKESRSYFCIVYGCFSSVWNLVNKRIKTLYSNCWNKKTGMCTFKIYLAVTLWYHCLTLKLRYASVVVPVCVATCSTTFYLRHFYSLVHECSTNSWKVSTVAYQGNSPQVKDKSW